MPTSMAANGCPSVRAYMLGKHFLHFDYRLFAISFNNIYSIHG